ncbi:MAG: DNA ligase [Comamonadaceae bacterium]|nr:MAG: DNA ligase [Comamonadaceae bacterium]
MASSRRRFLIAALACSALLPLSSPQAAAPALLLADVYRPGLSLSGWWVSEKYDGMRARWDGQHLWSRGGERIAAPAWFTADWPAQPLDGELWGGRGQFELTVSTVRRQQPEDKDWREIRFMVFDLPAHAGTFDERLKALQRLLPLPAAPWLVLVPQQPATTHTALMALRDKTLKLGGEGLMLHRGASLYRAERSGDLLKVKPHQDAEAVVIRHIAGQGRNAGRLGALQVRAPDGRRFRLGSGFTDAQRRNPPPIGATVTYRYDGLTASGLPRFARFVRERKDL